MWFLFSGNLTRDNAETIPHTVKILVIIIMVGVTTTRTSIIIIIITATLRQHKKHYVMDPGIC